jgi:hypothetical protein
VRASLWLIGAGAYLAAMTLGVSSLMGAAGPSWSPLFLAQQAAALATGALAVNGALSSVIPGSPTSWRPLLGASAAAWLVLLAVGMGRDLQTLGSVGLGAETDWPCVALITLGGAVLTVPLVRMLRRGAPFTPRSTAFLGGLGALSIASIAACLARPHGHTVTVLVWHGATLVLLAAVLGCAGRPLLRGPRSPLSANA